MDSVVAAHLLEQAGMNDTPSGPRAHPVARLDDVVHQRVRLGLLSVLAEVDRADFTFLRDRLGLSDGNLSRHLQVLEEAGFVQTQKVFERRKPRTWVTSTRTGRQAFKAELEALSDLVRSHRDAQKEAR